MSLASLRRQLTKIAKAMPPESGKPEVVIWLPRNSRGPCRDYRMGRGQVRFYDPANPPEELTESWLRLS